MKTTVLPLAFASVLAVAGFPSSAGAADPKTNATVEAADRQFLADLESGAPSHPAPVTEIQRPAPAPEKPEPAAPKVVVTGKKSSDRSPTVKHVETTRKTEPVEVRRALPVTTTTITTTSQVSRDEDDDDHDRDHDHDSDEDHGNGFFHRLFRGEKIFR